ncbi:MAG: hypothetical protein ACI35R_02550 [Bacillus sp. (in: firmicutes)]
MKTKKKPYLIAEILLNRQLPLHVIIEITNIPEEEILMLQFTDMCNQK